MPYNLQPQYDCISCPHGGCISYIRELSKKMKDRDTLYRLSQKAIMACSFDNYLPGFTTEISINTTFNDIVNQCINNGLAAGFFLQNNHPNYFGVTEASFGLTSGQTAKVRGDIFEFLIRAILWNSSLCKSGLYTGNYPYDTQDIFYGNMKHSNYIAITLGDNYDLKKLFTPEAAKEFSNFENYLSNRGTSFCYSTPDLVVIKCNDNNIWNNYIKPINNLSIPNQNIVNHARALIEGTVSPEDIVLAAGIKTSIRSDRMYQLLFEANAWKTIWRTVYMIPPSKYFGLIGSHYGADPNKLNSVEFSSVNAGNLDNAEKAIDGLVPISTPAELMRWYSNAF
ncbi:Cfr10I/Bse634I family restriction endonuclease [Pantoea agglomerans]|uniref:Cfr10I/Bse634I family restriction endonuclease n=1 Tax=Enterobacter agglomerans TaxID=549 RepID=UPI00177D414D|nr:Cfr10I/Bse634I family restriction endonuclease [Pantoea agglomerans]MBD8133830.1 Cfr10I/Bse634I family restriction endonuclease [Pantoea agglomerans]